MIEETGEIPIDNEFIYEENSTSSNSDVSTIAVDYGSSANNAVQGNTSIIIISVFSLQFTQVLNLVKSKKSC